MCRHAIDLSRAVLVAAEPPPTTAANIRDCTITTDSVVATVLITTDTVMRRIVVQWGDGTINTLRNRPGLEAAIGHQQSLPPGTYKMTHAYAAPEHRGPFQQIVLIKVEDGSGAVDFTIRHVTLTPRYRVTNYRTALTLVFKCDSYLETQSEFDITQYVEDAIAGRWKWRPNEPAIGHVGYDGVPIVLDGSIVSRELTVADGSVSIHIEAVDRDPLIDEKLPRITQDLSASSTSGTVEGTVTETASGCEVGYRWDREVTLIVPLPQSGQSVVLLQA